jgi:hypothetical protein
MPSDDCTAGDTYRLHQAEELIAALEGEHAAAQSREIILEVDGAPRVIVRVEAGWREVQRIAPDVAARLNAKVTEAGIAGDMAAYHRCSGAWNVWQALADFAEAEALAPSDDAGDE